MNHKGIKENKRVQGNKKQKRLYRGRRMNRELVLFYSSKRRRHVGRFNISKLAYLFNNLPTNPGETK